MYRYGHILYFESWYRSSCDILYEHGLKAAMVSRPCRLLDSAHRKDDYTLPAHPPYKQQNQHFAPWEYTIPQRDADLSLCPFSISINL